MSDACLQVRNDGATRLLVLNRPHRRNALDAALLDALATAVAEASADDGVRSLVLAGAGKGFCSGRDQDDVTASTLRLDDGSLEQAAGQFTDLLRQLLHCRKPTIAAVHGHALAAGQALTLACDFLVAEDDARFGNPEMRFGFPAAMNTVLLARHLGRRRALEIALTGAIYPATAYDRFGLVNRLVPPGTAQQVALELARELNGLAPWAIRETKRLLDAVDGAALEPSLIAGERLNQLLCATAVMASDATTRADIRRDLGGHPGTVATDGPPLTKGTGL